jgi:protein required for attachment to host cells
MNFSVPQNALIVVADGQQVKFFRNTIPSGIKLEIAKDSPINLNVDDGRGTGRLPTEMSVKEMGEANHAKHIANNLNERMNDGNAIVLIADPQTLGQIRNGLKQDVVTKICGELHKTLTKSTIPEIETILKSALSSKA